MSKATTLQINALVGEHQKRNGRAARRQKQGEARSKLAQVKLDLGSSRLDTATLQVGCRSCYKRESGWCQKLQGLNLSAEPENPVQNSCPVGQRVGCGKSLLTTLTSIKSTQVPANNHVAWWFHLERRMTKNVGKVMVASLRLSSPQ